MDVALTSVPANVTNSGSFNTCISDHNLIFATLQFSSKLRKSIPKLITVRNYKNIDDKPNLKSDLESIPWHLIDIFDPDDSAWSLEKLLKQTISEPRQAKKSQGVGQKSTMDEWRHQEKTEMDIAALYVYIIDTLYLTILMFYL